MARGLIAGMLAGAVVSGVGLGAASVIAPPPERGSPAAALPDVPAGSGFNQGRDDMPAELPAFESVATDQAAVAPVAAPEPDALTLDAGGAAPAGQPQIGDVQTGLSAPEVSEGSGIVLQEEGAGMADALAEAAEVAEAADVAEVAENPVPQTSISTEPAQPALPEAEEEAFPSAQVLDPEAEPELGAEPENAAADAAQEGAEDSAAEMAEAVPEEEIAALVPQPEATPEPEPAPSSTIGNLATEVETGRLPSVGDPEPEATGDTTEESTAEATRDTAAASEPGTPRPAIEAFAAPFDNPEAKPLMGIVLIDDGSSKIGVDALASFPYPLTFAVDAAWPGAAEAMALYRAKGFEVMVMADLPEGAQAVDSEVTMQTVLTAVPEAVAVLEGTGTGLQAGRDVSEQLARILTETGHGLVLFSNGLDTAQKLIAREGVPVGAVFRDFDAKGQDAKVIRRFLDQAAFKAARDEEEAVIMLGRLRADTISALLLWGLQDRASRVALAPISAVLTAGQ